MMMNVVSIYVCKTEKETIHCISSLQ